MLEEGGHVLSADLQRLTLTVLLDIEERLSRIEENTDARLTKAQRESLERDP